MSGLEAIAVIGVVASLITAFKDSSSIANAIKQRRRNRPEALPPTVELEEALTEGEQEIQKAAAAGIRRYGSGWVEQDLEAKMALQMVVIEVQATLLRDLSIAVQDDSVNDFSGVIDVSTEARMKAVNILTGLYLRKISHASFSAITQPSQISQALAPAVELLPPQSQPIAVPSREEGFIQLPRPRETGEVRKKSRSWSRKFSSWTTSYVDEVIANGIPETRTEQLSISTSQYEPSMSSELAWIPPPYKLRNQEPRINRAHPLTNSFSQNDSDSRRSVHSTQEPFLNRQDTRLSSQAVITISPENNFGGFCEGAYHLQVGLPKKALKRKNESVSMTGQRRYFACMNSHCVFEGPAVQSALGWSYDKDVRSSPGLKYTWLFLAKSHIPQSRQSNRLFDFRCLICLLLGDQSTVFHGQNELLEHVVGHAGSELFGITLYGPLAMTKNSLVQGNDQTFDLDLMPRRQSSMIENFSSTSTRISPDAVSVDDVWRDADDSISTFQPDWR